MKGILCDAIRALGLITPLMFAPPLLAQSLEYAGIVGNSGESGWSLVRSSVGRCGGGVVVDDRGRVYTGGGDRVLVLNRNGKRLWENLLPNKGWVLGGPTFALAVKYLYFIAGNPVRYEGNYNLLWCPWTLVEPNLCRVERAPDSTPEVLAPRDKFKWIHPWWNGEMSLTASPHSDQVYLGYSTATSKQGQPIPESFEALQIQPQGSLRPLFKSEARGGRLSVDEERNFYLGGGGQVHKVDDTGRPIPTFLPTAYPSLGAVPTGYTGAVMLTKEALWEMGHYGFLGRYTRDMKPAPGVVVQWAHALCWVAQIADGPGGTYYLKSNEALYLAKLEEDKLKLLHRFGSLPRVFALVVTRDGYIGTGNDTSSSMLWFRFEDDDPATPPVRTEYPGPITQGFTDDDNSALAYGINPGYLSRDYSPTPKGISLERFKPEPFTESRNHCQTLASGEYDGDLSALTRVGSFYYAIDRKTNRLCRASLKESCKLTAVEEIPLTASPRLTSLCALAGRGLVLAMEDSLRCYEASPDGALTPTWRLNAFGQEPDKSLGKELYLANSGNQLLVADTQRQRVLLFMSSDKTEWPPVFESQFGETDRAGEDCFHFNAPTLVSLQDGKAVVYDSANQRIVKLRIR